MKFDLDVLDVGVADVVLGQATRGVIVTKDRGREGGTEFKAGEEFTEEADFMGGVVESNIFSIT